LSLDLLLTQLEKPRRPAGPRPHRIEAQIENAQRSWSLDGHPFAAAYPGGRSIFDQSSPRVRADFMASIKT